MMAKPSDANASGSNTAIENPKSNAGLCASRGVGADDDEDEDGDDESDPVVAEFEAGLLVEEEDSPSTGSEPPPAPISSTALDGEILSSASTDFGAGGGSAVLSLVMANLIAKAENTGGTNSKCDSNCRAL